MFAILVILTSTFLQESADTLGKKAVKERRQSVYSLAFLGMFWSLIFLIIATILGAKFVFTTDSLPTFIPRILLETLLTYVMAEAIVRADRSTLGFLRVTTIPLLLIVDIVLGYHLTTLQFIGVGIMFSGLLLAFHDNPAGKKGSRYALVGAIISVATASLFKWDITHYNSVAGEQIVAYCFLLTFFYIQAVQKSGHSPLSSLIHPKSGTQSLSSGFGAAIESFAYGFAPVSVVISLKRSLALMWSVIFGHTFFGEEGIRYKAYAGMVVVVGLFLLVTPYV